MPEPSAPIPIRLLEKWATTLGERGAQAYSLRRYLKPKQQKELDGIVHEIHSAAAYLGNTAYLARLRIGKDVGLNVDYER